MKTTTRGGSTPRHGEAKKPRTVYLTDDAWDTLNLISEEFLITRSELIQQLCNGKLRIERNEAKTA
ncbi:MAG: hypothetical protein KME46_33360 [Brasilonema angustatum HA4187-MV1]|jgi:hypothetical protein|nr:hypothetical protein [Brasilonema angustatum HA4187-MV1]